MPGQQRLTGRGATVLLLDNGIDGSTVFGPNFICLSEQGNSTLSDHSFRAASVCGDPLPIGAPAGLAPEARFYSFNHALIEPGRFLECFQRIQERTERIDVVCVAWSAPATLELARQGKAWAAELSRRGILIVAAAGHDGPGRVRIPALWNDVLSVGLHDEHLKPVPFCSRSEAFGKPELSIENIALAARDNTGSHAVIRGTSAAAAVISGLAALYVEWLSQLGQGRCPALLKASLLAATRPMAESYSRALAPEWLFHGPNCFFTVAVATGTDHVFRLEKEGGTACRIAVVTTSHGTECSFLSSFSAVELEVRCEDEKRSQSATVGHLVADLPDTWSGRIDVYLRFRGAQCSAAVVVQGANERQAKARHAVRRGRLTLGISASHNASACVLEGHQVKRAIQLERLSRHKADGEPFLDSDAAARYCLESLGIRSSEIDIFAYNSQPVLPGWTGLSRPLATRQFTLFDPFGPSGIFVSHHLAHAFAAYCASPFTEAVVIVADGAGGGIAGPQTDLLLQGPEMRAYLEQESTSLPGIHVTSIYIFNSDGFHLVEREYAPSFNPRCGSSSLGETYASVSQYIFGNWLDGGKLMGLAPYGNRNAQPSLLQRKDGQLTFRSAWKLSYCNRAAGDPLEHKDLAARIQADFEEAILDRTRNAIRRTGQKKIIFTGGLALNCAANERIQNESGCTEAFFFPAANDAGISIGAAQAAVFRQSGKIRATSTTPWSDFLGHPYDGRDYEVAIEEAHGAITVNSLSTSALSRSIAEGWIVAWFEGGSEFGPRSLGHRSILASPRTRDTWHFINRRIKGREDFRPFAPIVAEEDAKTYFELDVNSPYMLRVVKIREAHRALLGAVCHVDGSARVQTVDVQTAPRLHALLIAMKEFSHPPILLNTSLNVAGEPIIETPSEAIRFLLTRPIDALVLGDRLLRRRMPPDNLLTAQSILDLAPGARLVQINQPNSFHISIESDLLRERLPLTPIEHRIIAAFNGKRSIANAQEVSGVRDLKYATLPFLIALRSKGLLIYYGEARA